MTVGLPLLYLDDERTFGRPTHFVRCIPFERGMATGTFTPGPRMYRAIAYTTLA